MAALKKNVYYYCNIIIFLLWPCYKYSKIKKGEKRKINKVAYILSS